MRYRLRTLLIVMAVLPPAIWTAWSYWPRPAEDLDKFRIPRSGAFVEVYDTSHYGGGAEPLEIPEPEPPVFICNLIFVSIRLCQTMLDPLVASHQLTCDAGLHSKSSVRGRCRTVITS